MLPNPQHSVSITLPVGWQPLETMMSNPIVSQGNVLPQLHEKRLSDFDALYDQYAPALFGIIKKTISDEQQASYVLQLAFQKIWQEKAGFNPEKMRLFTWLCQVTLSQLTAYKTGTGEQVSNLLRSVKQNQSADSRLVHNNNNSSN